MHIHQSPLAYYGGSFDPIHMGHLQTALTLCNNLQLSKLYLLPCGQPVFKSICHANAQQRLDMLELAIQDHLKLQVDTRELFKTSPSYTIETLEELRSEISKVTPLIFILGQDAFCKFNQWKNWQAILNYTHLIVIERQELKTPFSKELVDYLQQHETFDIEMLKQTPHGLIYQYHAGSYPYSSTQIRAAIATHAPPLGLDKKVLDYIKEQRLYQPS